MKLKLVCLFTMISLVILAIPVLKNNIVHADDGNPADKIESGLKQRMSNLKSTDSASINVHMKWDAVAEINEAATLTDTDIEEINSEIQRRKQAAWEEFKKEAGWSAEELFKARDDAAISSYAELLGKYGADWESERLMHLGINEPWVAIQTRITQQIEAVPDTRVLYREFKTAGPVLMVSTKVGRVEAIAEIPGVTYICDNVYGTIIDGNPRLKLLYPPVNLVDCRINKSTFMWLPYQETTKYKLVLANDAAMTQIVGEAEVTTTSYEYDGKLEYSTGYFWRVMAVEPAPSDWSATFAFKTEAEPPSPPEATPQPTSWPAALIVVIIMALAASAGLITWLLIARRNRSKQ